MQCTTKEIEEKRRQAQERLSRKRLISQINVTNSNLIKSPVLHQNGLKSPSNAALRGAGASHSKPYNKPVQTPSFYGKSNVVTGTCSLISEDRFVVELSSYCAPAIEIFKTIQSRFYNVNTKFWDFHINDYKLLHSKISPLKPDIMLGKLPSFALSCCLVPKANYSNIDLSSIDPELRTALMPFQQEGVRFGIDKDGRCLIADEMGLGKTFQALAIANYYKNDWPLLIVTTASMKNDWEETIHKYIPSVSVMHTQYMVSTKDYIGDTKILIVSYDMMSRCLEKLLERNFKSLIIDESHTLKNFKAKCTKVATELAKQANRVILLSGTPALSRPSELYTQLALLDDKFFGNFFEYSKRYCNGKSTHFGWDATGKSNLQELEVILSKKFMIRRTKQDVLKMLPDKEQQIVELDVDLNQLSVEDRRLLNSLADNYNRQKKGCDKHAALLTFFSETAKIKIPSVCSYILQILEETKKFIVFAHHQKMLDAIEQVLHSKKKKFIRIDGSTLSVQRKLLVDKFQLDDDYECALLSITAANAGITLTAAKLVLFAELHWNPSILSQAESRAHRIGQDEKVLIQYLLASGTADDSIWPILQNKQKILQEVGLSKDCFDNVPITKQDLNGKETVAQCLNSEVTSVNTLDISSYFHSPNKLENNLELKIENNLENQSIINDLLFECDNFDEWCLNKENNSASDNFNRSNVEEEFFNDGFDDLLSNVKVNI